MEKIIFETVHDLAKDNQIKKTDSTLLIAVKVFEEMCEVGLIEYDQCNNVGAYEYYDIILSTIIKASLKKMIWCEKKTMLRNAFNRMKLFNIKNMVIKI